jgi:hypothetical protein
MTGTNCDLFTDKSSRSYFNHLVLYVCACACAYACACVYAYPALNSYAPYCDVIGDPSDCATFFHIIS